MSKGLTKTIYHADEAEIRAEVKRAEASCDPSLLAAAQDALAHLYRRQGNARKAARTAEAALALLPPEMIAERVALNNTRIESEMVAGRHSLVIELSPKAINDAKLLGNPYYTAQAYGNFANALKHSGEIDRAIIEFTSARTYFEIADHPRHAAATDNNLAELYTKIGDTEQAHEYLDRAESFFRDHDEPSVLGQVLETRARAFAATGDLDSAKKAIDESLELIPESHKKIRAESYRTRGEIEQAQGKDLEAEFSFLEAIRLVSEIEG